MRPRLNGISRSLTGSTASDEGEAMTDLPRCPPRLLVVGDGEYHNGIEGKQAWLDASLSTCEELTATSQGVVMQDFHA